MLTRLSLRLRILLFFAALALGALAALGLGLWLGHLRLGQPDSTDAFVQAGVIAGFAILGLVTGVWYLFDLNLAKPIEGLAAALRARTHADVGGGLETDVARYLGDLAPAASAAAEHLAETRNALAEAVARETASLSVEKERLEALLADVPVGVLLCSGDHQLVFYNGPAAEVLAADIVMGLDRPLFDFLDDAPVRHAHDRLIATGDPEAASDLLCATRQGARLLAARMRLVPLSGAVPGYVLSFHDVTAETEDRARQEAAVEAALDSLRRSSAGLATLVEVLPDADLPAPVARALRDETRRLTSIVTGFSRQRDEAETNAWPLTQTRASDLADGLSAQLSQTGMALRSEVADLLLRCNGFDMVAFLAVLARQLGKRGFGDGLQLAIAEEESGAAIRLLWRGAPLPLADLERWLDLPLAPAGDRPLRAVLAAHATEVWPETLPDGMQALCLPIRHARRAVRRAQPVKRPVVYDFELLFTERAARLADARLDRLTYVVFDTETTGLLPRQGDRIVQIAGVRIVNGRRVAGEVFDTLVNPGRAIPAVATEVHGITDAMVADAPPVGEVARAFHKFAEGAVLVAHNAPFDMDFLRQTEAAIGLRFDMPILDTVLLSAVIYGQHETHSLDALTHRLGITIPEEARHTAIGDTVATADALLKLIPMLAGRSLATFGAVLAEVRRHGRLLKDLN